MVVRPLEKLGLKTADSGRAGELGNRILRVSSTSAGKPHWIWQADVTAAEDAARSDHIERIRAVQRVLHAAADPGRFSLGGAVHVRRCVLDVPRRSNIRLRISG